MVSVGIIGSGAWGTTLGLLLAKKNIPTTLWEHNPQRALEMQQQRENKEFLPDFPFPSVSTSNLRYRRCRSQQRNVSSRHTFPAYA